MSRLAKSKIIIRVDKDGNNKLVTVLKDDLDDNSIDTIHIKDKSITKNKLSDNMTGVSIGKSGTGENSEIFNDYDNNKASGDLSSAKGKGTIASGNVSSVDGQYNMEDNNDKYVHITGNGTSDNNRSNAYTLDWDGNSWFHGLIKIGGDSYDDTNAKEIATKDDVTSIVDNKITELGDILTKEEIIKIIDERISETILSGGDSEINNS